MLPSKLLGAWNEIAFYVRAKMSKQNHWLFNTMVKENLPVIHPSQSFNIGQCWGGLDYTLCESRWGDLNFRTHFPNDRECKPFHISSKRAYICKQNHVTSALKFQHKGKVSCKKMLPSVKGFGSMSIPRSTR